ncbi:Yos1-like [Novymonas esmeraldas]|uniref:Yos1-like n=1 Tax=Novymonas esmeraldas TaxID=1808958 RepID=A0AAW0ENV5_9TRYP
MGLSIYSLASAVALCLNALAILSESRFLSKFGLATPQALQGGAAPQMESAFNDVVPSAFDSDYGVGSSSGGGTRSASSLKLQIASLLHSVRLLMRWPLIFVNVTLISLALIFG